jgi:hypothetical protein
VTAALEASQAESPIPEPYERPQGPSETPATFPVEHYEAITPATPPTLGQTEPTSNEFSYDSNDLARDIDSERRAHKLTPYRPKHADYQVRQDAVEEILAIAEAEHVTPSEVAVRSLRNFYSSKDAWLHNNGYPLGSWAKQVGHYFNPPKLIPTGKSDEGTGSMSAIYAARAAEALRKQRETDRVLAEEAARGEAVGVDEIKSMVSKLKTKNR